MLPWWWCPCALRLVSTENCLALHRITLTWCSSALLQEDEQNIHSLCCSMVANWFRVAAAGIVTTFSFGLFHRWRVRASSLLDLRFNGEGVLGPSSVMHIRNLQLGSFQPQVHMPIRSPGEPLRYYWPASTPSEAPAP